MVVAFLLREASKTNKANTDKSFVSMLIEWLTEQYNDAKEKTEDISGNKKLQENFLC